MDRPFTWEQGLGLVRTGQLLAEPGQGQRLPEELILGVQGYDEAGVAHGNHVLEREPRRDAHKMLLGRGILH